MASDEPMMSIAAGVVSEPRVSSASPSTGTPWMPANASAIDATLATMHGERNDFGLILIFTPYLLSVASIHTPSVKTSALNARLNTVV